MYVVNGQLGMLMQFYEFMTILFRYHKYQLEIGTLLVKRQIYPYCL